MLLDQARAMRGTAQPEGAANESSADASAQGGTPAIDWRQFTPPEQVDAVQRVIAAGAKLMYSEDMREELVQAVKQPGTSEEKLALNVAGLLLTMDKQSQGGIPVEALFPAGLGLLSEAADVLRAAGQEVTQDDLNDAALRLYVVIGKKLGGTDEQIQQSAEQALAGQAEQPPPPTDPSDSSSAAGADEQEMAGMKQGMQ